MNDTHLGGCYNPDPVLIVPDVWEKLIERYNPKSLIDVGCGYGWAMEWFKKKGLSVIGLEGFAPAVENNRCPNEVRWCDFATTKPVCYGHVDLCWCAEFVEHVEEQYIPNFMPCLKLARVIAMTHATPGQGGYHHVNEQPREYWIKLLEENGFKYCEKETVEMRRPAPWGVNNLLIFEQCAKS